MNLTRGHLDGARPAPPGRTGSGRRLRYQQVIDLVEALIGEGRLTPGAMLPTQKELAARAGVSLITVRRALLELEREGIVASHQGVGTFVARPRLFSDPTRSGGLLATLGGQDAVPPVLTEVLELGEAHPRPAVAQALGIPPDDKVWRILRLRRIDSQPLVIEQALVPRALAPDLGHRRAELSGSLYALLAREHGLVDDHEEQYLEVVTPEARERRLLDLPARKQVVRLRGVSFTAAGLPFDCFEQVYPAAEFVFYVSGQTAGRLLRPAALRDWGTTPARERL